MDMAWKYLTYFSGAIACWAIYTANQQKKDMWDFAGKVVQPIERRGGETSVTDDGSIKVQIDGKVIDVLPKAILDE